MLFKNPGRPRQQERNDDGSTWIRKHYAVTEDLSEVLNLPAPISLVGMAKKSEGKAFQFALGGNCSGWVTIPLEFVEDVEVLRSVTCKDHSRPLVSLKLKSPRTPEGKLFLVMLEGMQAASATRHSPFAMPRSAVGGHRSSAYGPMAVEPGSSPCYRHPQWTVRPATPACLQPELP